MSKLIARVFRFWPAGLFGALLLVSACASTPEAGGDRVAVRVENNLIPPSSLTVWAHPRVGTRVMVGVVAPSETKTLHFRPAGVGGEFVLVAETTGGRAVTSNPVTGLSPGSTVVWDLSSNIATVR